MEQDSRNPKEIERPFTFPVFEPVPLQPEIPLPMDIAPQQEKLRPRGPIVIDLADYDDV